MKDLLLIALFAALGAGGAGLLGWAAVRLLRRRSLALALFCVAAVTVLAVTSGTFAVAQAMFLSRHDLGVVITVLVMASVVSLATAALLGRQVVAGGRALTVAARTVGSDTGFTAPEPPLGLELAQLSEELAATSARLAESRARAQALDTSRRELIAWISHDLRTPLAGLRAMAEALEDGVAEHPQRYLQRMRTEVERLTGMVDDLFELSRIQAGALALSLSRVSVYDLVDDALAGAHPLARKRGVRLEGRQVAAEPVEVDSGEITRVLGNLLVNAIRSTPEDGVVAVSARREADEVVLSVTDGCGGIPEQDLPRVFETGWRGSAARTPRPADQANPRRPSEGGGSGAGLGLAIVRGIVEAHAGRARVRNVAGGCCFEIVLPAART
ncbi:sensor histidine kinase [Kitasatospora aureofaciens]|uniref:histidine kinase n=1 Tax=Kitasatospora aureofaciens TaxID=1894 RepID=A0A1E7N7L6_KITAU|nr:HAMP domain-containing sensor histidine kinase [Kitasatospora aureofaciens]OEV36634.1 two-component sensor histidine kinase [Kitasatospora aureofaciens]QEV02913.1 sensor histidine kinase [Streptomyces viridifaciens]UKZ09533.1 HAMP domain-containing histidine kinase [Streptomyces viridifaciens]GGU57520.1 two-component sensor histidine kinase [Kitasatospora aureofaciens]